MKKLKKLLAIVLCIAMMVPATVLAAPQSSPAKVDLSKKATVTTASTLYYTGSTQKAKFVVKVNGKTLVAEQDYVVKGYYYVKNAGVYKVTVTGKGKYTGTKSYTYRVASKSVAPSNVAASASSKTYTGKKQATAITVKYGKTVLKKNVDYTVKGITAATNAGTYKITITGKGNFKGTKTITYTVKKAAQKVRVVAGKTSKRVYVSGVKGKAKVSYTTNNGRVKVSNGKVIVGKGVKKGTKVRVTVTVAATHNYKSYKKTVTYVVK